MKDYPMPRYISLALLLCCVSTLSLAEERLDMEGATVHGNVELPKVLYIVPWQQSELPDIGQPPLESLIDEALSPVDREVFQRQIRYYDALTAQDIRNSAK
jgi:hypothetical protein